MEYMVDGFLVASAAYVYYLVYSIRKKIEEIEKRLELAPNFEGMISRNEKRFHHVCLDRMKIKEDIKKIKAKLGVGCGG